MSVFLGQREGLLGSKSCWQLFLELELTNYIRTSLHGLLLGGMCSTLPFIWKAVASASSSILPSPNPNTVATDSSEIPSLSYSLLSFPFLRSPFFHPKSQESDVEGHSKLVRAGAISVFCICSVLSSIHYNLTADMSHASKLELRRHWYIAGTY